MWWDSSLPNFLINEPNTNHNRLMRYNWQHTEWPKFGYDLSGTEDMLFRFAQESGVASGILKALPEESQADAIINTLVAEAIKTSEIEGEYLSRPDVISSVRNNLGLNKEPDMLKDRMADGIGQWIVTMQNLVFLSNGAVFPRNR